MLSMVVRKNKIAPNNDTIAETGSDTRKKADYALTPQDEAAEPAPQIDPSS
jgi:hypothetical protein